MVTCNTFARPCTLGFRPILLLVTPKKILLKLGSPLPCFPSSVEGGFCLGWILQGTFHLRRDPEPIEFIPNPLWSSKERSLTREPPRPLGAGRGMGVSFELSILNFGIGAGCKKFPPYDSYKKEAGSALSNCSPH